MKQLISNFRGKLYTVQPGDATKYVFSFATVPQGQVNGLTREYLTQGSKDHREIIIGKIDRPSDRNDHFAGYHQGMTLYMISIYEPVTSASSFVIDADMLKPDWLHSSFIQYLKGHYPNIDPYTLAVVLIAARELAWCRRLPSKRTFQKALIEMYGGVEAVLYD